MIFVKFCSVCSFSPAFFSHHPTPATNWALSRQRGNWGNFLETPHPRKRARMEGNIWKSSGMQKMAKKQTNFTISEPSRGFAKKKKNRSLDVRLVWSYCEARTGAMPLNHVPGSRPRPRPQGGAIFRSCRTDGQPTAAPCPARKAPPSFLPFPSS